MKQRSAMANYTNDSSWWDTQISDIGKNRITIRGYPIQELIGNVTYAQMLYLLLCGELLPVKKAALLESVLVAGADHGPRAPSIAAARMAATCGVSFNSCIATGINLLGDAHGGAGEQAMKLFYDTAALLDHAGNDLRSVVEAQVDRIQEEGSKLPGFGHQLHDDDPRVRRLGQLARTMVDEGEISGKYLQIADEYLSCLIEKKKRQMTMNIDGISAAIQCELAIPSESAKGIFALSRGLGILAHAFEELRGGVLIKGPCPNDERCVRYSGPPLRHLAEDPARER